MLCQPSRATIATGTYPSTHGVTCNGIDLPEHWADRTISAHLGRAGYETAIFGKAHFASVYPFVPTGRLESVEGSAYMPEDWNGPYFGFEHAELILFGHNMRMAPLQGNWNWCFGPPPMGLHYGRYLFRDGPERGRERLAADATGVRRAVYDHTQTWASSLPEEDHPTTWVADRAIEWLQSVEGDFFAWVSFTDPHHPMDPPEPWAHQYDPADVLEMLPTAHPEEFDAKPPIHRFWTQGNRGGLFECANPGGAHYTARSCADDRRVLRDGEPARLPDRSGVADPRGAGPARRHARARDDRPWRAARPPPDDLQGTAALRRPPPGPVDRERTGLRERRGRDDPVGTIDIAPTALRAAGIELPEQLEGAPLQSTADREHTLTENDFDIVLKLRLRTLTTRDWKVTRYEDNPEVGELYALSEDPEELVNRWDDPECAPIRAEMLDALDATMNHDAHSEPKVGIVG